MFNVLEVGSASSLARTLVALELLSIIPLGSASLVSASSTGTAGKAEEGSIEGLIGKDEDSAVNSSIGSSGSTPSECSVFDNSVSSL